MKENEFDQFDDEGNFRQQQEMPTPEFGNDNHLNETACGTESPTIIQIVTFQPYEHEVQSDFVVLGLGEDGRIYQSTTEGGWQLWS